MNDWKVTKTPSNQNTSSNRQIHSDHRRYAYNHLTYQSISTIRSINLDKIGCFTVIPYYSHCYNHVSD